MTILKYFTFLNNRWKRLDHLQNYKPICPIDSTSYQKFVEQEGVFKFLEGLNMEYDPVRSRVLGMDVLSSLQEGFAFVQNEESCRSAMLSSAITNRSVLVFIPPRDGERVPHGSRPSFEKDNLFCDYCSRPRNTRETCWKLHGQGFKKRPQLLRNGCGGYRHPLQPL
ncbi:uncharacterized protein LOC114257509 [Camellia sinensis]|uniref:uncharacterized protein LOC114257509 n=1 Tax=Camellia sinensis TaxID=4442 RepID=UPI00103651C0|nr:uncharacterized protein LOC114257509 [Camellia sinensis]